MHRYTKTHKKSPWNQQCTTECCLNDLTQQLWSGIKTCLYASMTTAAVCAQHLDVIGCRRHGDSCSARSTSGCHWVPSPWRQLQCLLHVWMSLGAVAIATPAVPAPRLDVIGCHRHGDSCSARSTFGCHWMPSPCSHTNSTINRLVFASSKCDHITLLLRQLHWLKVLWRIDYKLAVLVYKCLHGMAPPYLANELHHPAVGVSKLFAFHFVSWIVYSPHPTLNLWRPSFSSHCCMDLEQSSAAYHICSVTSCLLLSLEDIRLQTLLPVITVVMLVKWLCHLWTR